MIERRYALSASPPSTTAFVLPALLCQLGARRTGAGKLHCQRFASVGQCAVDEDMASARLRIVLDQQSPAVRPGLRVRDSCGARPQRPPASPLHSAALPAVPTIRCAKAPLGAGHRLAPCRVRATGVMQSGLRRSRSHSPRLLVRRTRRRLRAFVVVVAPRYVVAEAVCQVLRLNDRFGPVAVLSEWPVSGSQSSIRKRFQWCQPQDSDAR